MPEKVDNQIVQIVNTPDDLKIPKYANSYSVSYTESDFLIEFGVMNKHQEENKVEIDVVSRIIFPKDRVVSFIEALFSSVYDYQKEYKTNIGLDIEPKQESGD